MAAAPPTLRESPSPRRRADGGAHLRHGSSACCARRRRSGSWALRPAADERGRGPGRTNTRPRRARLLVQPPTPSRGLAHLPGRPARRGLPRRIADGRRSCPLPRAAVSLRRILPSASSMPASWHSPSAWPRRRSRRSTSAISARSGPPTWRPSSFCREGPLCCQWWHSEESGEGADHPAMRARREACLPRPRYGGRPGERRRIRRVGYGDRTSRISKIDGNLLDWSLPAEP